MRGGVRMAAGYASSDGGAITRMDLSEPFRACASRFRSRAKDWRRIFAVLYFVGLEIPIECNDASRPQGFLEPALPLENRLLVQSPFTEQCSKNQRSERRGQNGRLSEKDTLIDRQSGVAEKADGKSRRPDDRYGADEGCDSGECRWKPGRNPNKQRTQGNNREFDCPLLIWKQNQESAQDGQDRKRQGPFQNLASWGKVAYQ